MTASSDLRTLPVRPDLERARREAWLRLARPGTWWTGVQRLALVQEARFARQCAVRRLRTRDGEGPAHSPSPELPSAAVELVHRLVVSPWRVHRDWAEEIIAALGEAEYVEAVAVVAMAVSLDVFDRALGRPLRVPPAAEPGAPTRERPVRLSSRAGWVAMARRGEMDPDPFAGVWTPNVCLALSLVPAETKALRDLIGTQYIPFEQVSSLKWRARPGLTRPQMEWLAVRVSAANRCFY